MMPANKIPCININISIFRFSLSHYLRRATASLCAAFVLLNPKWNFLICSAIIYCLVLSKSWTNFYSHCHYHWESKSSAHWVLIVAVALFLGFVLSIVFDIVQDKLQSVFVKHYTYSQLNAHRHSLTSLPFTSKRQAIVGKVELLQPIARDFCFLNLWDLLESLTFPCCWLQSERHFKLTAAWFIYCKIHSLQHSCNSDGKKEKVRGNKSEKLKW